MKNGLEPQGIVLTVAALILAALLVDSFVREVQMIDLRQAGETCVAFADSWTGPRIVRHWKPRPYDYVFDGQHYRGSTCSEEDYPARVDPARVGSIQ